MSNGNDSVNLFELAARKKLRFATPRGDITVEDLWELPLTSKSGFDLDTVAKAANRDLKVAGEESFVNATANPRQRLLEARLAIVKHVIATVQRENMEALARAGRKAERDRLVEILESKQMEKMQGMTPEQIGARIAEIDAAMAA